MPTRSIVDRLRAGERILMDGGTGSELQRRGADVLAGATLESHLQAWSATANVEFPEVVQQVHQDYLRCGADLVLSNNFWTSRTRLGPIGLGDDWEKYARAGAENAVIARDVQKPEAYVAGAFAPPAIGSIAGAAEPDVVAMGRSAFRSEVNEQVEVLVDAGVDVIFPEFVGHIEDCVEMVDVCSAFELPAFLGIRAIQPDGTMVSGDSLADLGRALDGMKVDAVMLMCSRPEAITAGLPVLRDSYLGPIGCYPNIGYNPMAPLGGSPYIAEDGPDMLNTHGNTPSELAAQAAEWRAMGSQVIGGCCASGPEHIMALRPVVKGT